MNTKKMKLDWLTEEIFIKAHPEKRKYILALLNIKYADLQKIHHRSLSMIGMTINNERSPDLLGRIAKTVCRINNKLGE